MFLQLLGISQDKASHHYPISPFKNINDQVLYEATAAIKTYYENIDTKVKEYIENNNSSRLLYKQRNLDGCEICAILVACVVGLLNCLACADSCVNKNKKK